LAFPRLGAPFRLWTDASDRGVGASLFQQQGGEWLPVAFVSHGLSACQQRWPIRDKEFYAIIWALKRLPFVRASPLEVIVDHESLAGDPPVSSPSAEFYSEQRWCRWTELLLTFDIRFTWVAGEHMVGPDFLSRQGLVCPDCPPDCRECRCRAARLRDCRSWEKMQAQLHQLRREQ
jgi:hypothetical protein